MKKASTTKDSLRSEYQRSDFPSGFVRGKYAARVKAASNIAVLDPELVSAFPNSAAVNDALRAILNVARHVAVHPHQDAPAKRPAARTTGGEPR